MNPMINESRLHSTFRRTGFNYSKIKGVFKDGDCRGPTSNPPPQFLDFFFENEGIKRGKKRCGGEGTQGGQLGSFRMREILFFKHF